jgi:L-threonylcarbamoyladenylate synthase
MLQTLRFDLTGGATAEWHAHLATAAELLQRGGLVAFPTETVYGLGAAALSEEAVARIFAVKGRPAGNPLIVHVHEPAAARDLAGAWPPIAEEAAARFWPGPLTLVVRRSSRLPAVVVAGGETVGLRMPAHPVALGLLRAAAIPVAAPSANRSTRISPTTAEHVLAQLAGRIDAVLDGGPTPGGIESTVLDVTVTPATILRPGPLSARELEQALGVPIADRAAGADAARLGGRAHPARSPGQQSRHYAPRARVELVQGDAGAHIAALRERGMRAGWLRLTRAPQVSPDDVVTIDMPRTAEGYGRRLYAALHELDAAGVDVIIVEIPPQADTWSAIQDRLRRAASRG